MVIFALTKRGLLDMLDMAKDSRAAIWINGGLLDAPEIERLRADGFDLTDFAHWIDPANKSAVDGAVEIIREHHPGRALYIEACKQANGS